MAKDIVYKVITDKIMGLLEDGVVPWHKPWFVDGKGPQNLISKIPYHGANVFILACQGFGSPYWLSYKQVKQLGGKIKDDEYKKYTPVIFSKKMTKKFDEKVTDPDGSEKTEEVEKSFWIARYYNVWNVEQCMDLDEKIPKSVELEPLDFTPIDECERIVEVMPNRPDIHDNGGRAFYSPMSDDIGMPQKTVFESNEEYYSTLFHELGHATGHESRLNRATVMENHFFGDKDYSKEELIAEMCAAFVCGHTGIENSTIDNSASYIQGWLKKLKNDRKLVVIAGAQAERSADFIMNRQRNNN